MSPLTLKSQEIAIDHPESVNMFCLSPKKPFVATLSAIEAYQLNTIIHCLHLLQMKAIEHHGLDYLQVFESNDPVSEPLWFIEDGDGGAITALLPSDY